MEMKGVSQGLIIGILIGVIIGVLLAASAFLCIRCRRKHLINRSSRSGVTDPIRTNGTDCCTVLSDTTTGQESPISGGNDGMALWREKSKRKNVISGIPRYPYKELQKATNNFTTVIGQGAFGLVYRAQMSTGQTVAVKVLSSDSRQGENEFHTEVVLLGRLHHRNLVNLVGYCEEKGQHMLAYEYMSNGSLASHLYSEKHTLNWELRVHIALDVARGLEYLHDGAVPSVVHRDIKSSNILLDRTMKARVADFGLSREAMVNQPNSNIKGTFGYFDPEYIATNAFTKKSDVYSFGVLLFELIAGRNPQQGLMEYVELASMNAGGRVGWEEIADSRLDGKFCLKELNNMGALAYKCVNRIPKKRPSMRDVVQTLLRIVKLRHGRKLHKRVLSATEVVIDIDMLTKCQIPFSGFLKDAPGDNVTDPPQV